MDKDPIPPSNEISLLKTPIMCLEMLIGVIVAEIDQAWNAFCGMFEQVL